MCMASKAKVFLSDRALADLQEIESFTLGRWGENQAAKHLDLFDRFFGLLEFQPGILMHGPLIDTLLTHTVESHVVVCTKWNDDVLVLTIVHTSRDIINHLDILLPTLKVEVELMKKRLP